MSTIDKFITKWGWLVLARCRDEFTSDLNDLVKQSEFVNAAMSGICEACGQPWCEDTCPALRGEFIRERYLSEDLTTLDAKPWVVERIKKLEADLAEAKRHVRNGTEPDILPGFGIACTVAWTELCNAMRADGHEVKDRSGPETRKWIVAIVRNTYKAYWAPREKP